MDEAEQGSHDSSRAGRLAAAAVFAVVFAAAWPRLPHGICFGDPGDLQIACMTLGVAHPPGYAAYAAVGWLATRLLFMVEPARLVSVGCMLCMAGAAALLARLLVRLGAGWSAAMLAGLALPLTGVAWLNTVVPEVYAPSLLLIAGAVYAMALHSGSGRRTTLLAAAGMLGLLLANRPPVVLMLPGFVLACLFAGRRVDAEPRRGRRLANVFAAAGVCAAVIAGGIAWTALRESPATAYNYVQQHIEATGEPSADAARVDRLRWLLSGEEFRHWMGVPLADIPRRVWFIRETLSLESWPALLAVLLTVLVGSFALWRRSRAVVAVLWGILLGDLAYVCQYRMFGQAADLLPAIWAGLVLMGGCATAFPRPGGDTQARSRSAGAGLIVAGAAVGLVALGWTRHDYAARADGQAYADAAGVETLEHGAVIVTDWDRGRPLWYAALRAGRRDLRIVAPRPNDLHTFDPRSTNDVVLYADEMDPPSGYHLEQRGNLWRLVPRGE